MIGVAARPRAATKQPDARDRAEKGIRALLDALGEYARRFHEFDSTRSYDHNWAERVLPVALKFARHMSQKLETRLGDDVRIELELRLADFEASLANVLSWFPGLRK